MRFGVGAIARVIRPFRALCVISVLFALFGFSIAAYAQGSTLQTIVNSGTLHPALELTSPSSPVVVAAMPLDLAGTVSSLSQIQVYVDDVFSVTIPLDEGATAFEYSLVVPIGVHAVKLVGISPFADNSPTVTLSVTYTPPVTPTEPTVQPPTSTTVSEQKGGAVISRDGNSSSSTNYVEPTNVSSLPTWFYGGLVALDIARPGDSDKEIAQMIQRVVVVSAASFLLVFARPALTLYRIVRYSWLGWHKHPLPNFMRHHSLFHIRIVGILLMFSVFSFS